MSMAFARRLARLEAQHPSQAAEPYEPPEPPEGWYGEVMRLLIASGHLERVLHETFHVPVHEVAAVAAMMAEEVEHAL
jgi:hypothetical protein